MAVRITGHCAGHAAFFGVFGFVHPLIVHHLLQQQGHWRRALLLHDAGGWSSLPTTPPTHAPAAASGGGDVAMDLAATAFAGACAGAVSKSTTTIGMNWADWRSTAATTAAAAQWSSQGIPPPNAWGGYRRSVLPSKTSASCGTATVGHCECSVVRADVRGLSPGDRPLTG